MSTRETFINIYQEHGLCLLVTLKLYMMNGLLNTVVISRLGSSLEEQKLETAGGELNIAGGKNLKCIRGQLDYTLICTVPQPGDKSWFYCIFP